MSTKIEDKVEVENYQSVVQVMLEADLSSQTMNKVRKGKSKVENIPTRTNPKMSVKSSKKYC